MLGRFSNATKLRMESCFGMLCQKDVMLSSATLRSGPRSGLQGGSRNAHIVVLGKIVPHKKVAQQLRRRCT